VLTEPDLSKALAFGTLGGTRFAFGVMPMPTSYSSLERSQRSAVVARIRAGQIGPIRREIIFEPLPEPKRIEPSPVAPAPVSPETQPEEPTPVAP
jgi:hypothetical protein